MDGYKISNMKTQVIASNGETKKTVKRIERKDDTKMRPEELVKIFKTMKDKIETEAHKQGKTVLFRVFVSTGTGFFSFTDPDQIKDEDEYWVGKVKDKTKFTSFDFADIHIMVE